MPVRYCSQHERLLSKKYNAWIDFPIEKMQAIKDLYELFHAVHIDTPVYNVIETDCDRCAEIACQRRGALFDRFDPN